MTREAADSPQAQLNRFMARYHPDIAKLGRAALVAMRKRLPGTIEMVYDNFNALAQAVTRSDPPIDPKARRKLVIRAVSAKQRPRR